MAHFLDVCKLFNDILVSAHDTMSSMSSKVEERDHHFTDNVLYTLKVISDIPPSFVNGYSRKADTNQLLVTEVYNQAQSYAGEILTTNTSQIAWQLLPMVIYNVCFESMKMSTTLLWTDTQKRKRGFTLEQKLDEMNEKLEDLKDPILHNIDENVRNQCGSDRFYYNWPDMFLREKITIDERIKRLTL